jgi:hypothetical protein
MIINIYNLIFDFLNNNLGVITLLVGSIAIGLYIHQKRDYKKGIAKLILQEIRYAEKQIKIARERSNIFLLSNALLPTNSWYNNIHLFVYDLEETDRDSISDFYAKVSFLDRVIGNITQFKINQLTLKKETRSVLQPRLIQQDEPGTFSGAPAGNVQEIPITEFQLSAEIILKEVADQIAFLYNTPAAAKLREISRRKWYQKI